MPRDLIDAIGIASLAAGFSVLASNAGSAWPFLALFALAVAVRAALDWRWLRARLPVGRPFGVEAMRLELLGAEIRAMPNGDERRSRAITWEREVWAAVESYAGDKGRTTCAKAPNASALNRATDLANKARDRAREGSNVVRLDPGLDPLPG